MVKGDPEFMTVKEAAAYLRVEPQTVRRWMHGGTLPGFRIGKLFRLRRCDVTASSDRQVHGKQDPAMG